MKQRDLTKTTESNYWKEKLDLWNYSLGGCPALEQQVATGDEPTPSSGVAAALCWMSRVLGQRSPNKTVGAGAAVKRYPTSKGKGEASARW